MKREWDGHTDNMVIHNYLFLFGKGSRQKVTSNANQNTTIIKQHNVFTWNIIQTYIKENLMLMFTDCFLKKKKEKKRIRRKIVRNPLQFRISSKSD